MTNISFSASQPSLLYNLSAKSTAEQGSSAQNSVNAGEKPEEQPQKDKISMKTPLIIGTIALAAIGCYLGRGKIKEFLGFVEKNTTAPAANGTHIPEPPAAVETIAETAPKFKDKGAQILSKRFKPEDINASFEKELDGGQKLVQKYDGISTTVGLYDKNGKIRLQMEYDKNGTLTEYTSYGKNGSKQWDNYGVILRKKLSDGNFIRREKNYDGSFKKIIYDGYARVLSEVSENFDGTLHTKTKYEYLGLKLIKKTTTEIGTHRSNEVVHFGENGAYARKATKLSGEMEIFEELVPSRYKYKEIYDGKTLNIESVFINPSTKSTTRTVRGKDGKIIEKITNIRKYNSDKCVIPTEDVLLDAKGQLIAKKTYKHAPGATDTFAVLDGKEVVVAENYKSLENSIDSLFNSFADRLVKSEYERLNLK